MNDGNTIQRVEVLIASPSDVPAERDVVSKLFNGWNSANHQAFLHPVMWESASVPELGAHPQEILNKSLIERSDLLVAILWSKLGTPTPTAPSGTVDEIREFIRLKGAARVMLYFCTRDFPHDVDPANLALLNQFKAEIRTMGLYQDYHSVKEFEGLLYRHLDVKVQQLLRGDLPLPSLPKSATKEFTSQTKDIRDSRLREPIHFGSTLESISAGFNEKVVGFEKLDGAGPDKFLDLGAHVCSSCAKCLDRFLTYSAPGLAYEDRVVIERISSRLKILASHSSDYVKRPFPEFWKDQKAIADELAAHVHHLSRVTRK